MSSKENVSTSTKNLMLLRGVSHEELGQELRKKDEARQKEKGGKADKKFTERYVRRKIRLNLWTFDQLDDLAEIFDVAPEKLVRGIQLRPMSEVGDDE